MTTEEENLVAIEGALMVALARIDQLEAVLMPFARAGKYWVLDDEHDQDPISKMGRASKSIMVGDAALEGHSP